MSSRSVPKSVTLNDLERRSGRYFCVISPNFRVRCCHETTIRLSRFQNLLLIVYDHIKPVCAIIQRLFGQIEVITGFDHWTINRPVFAYLIVCHSTASKATVINIVQSMENHHNRFTALFPRPPGWAGARRELLDFMVQGEINRGRHTDHPAGCHSIRTNQCPPPPSPIFFYGPDALPSA